MSHDLYLTRPAITLEQFEDYFSDRPNYDVSDAQAVYQNENTGVYFVVEHNDPSQRSAGGEDAGDLQPEEDLFDYTATVSLNYYRPHVFGLEAVEEVAAFVEHFGFSVLDEQSEGMGDGPFSREGYLRSWNFGNEFGYSSILRGEDRPDKVWSMPASRLEAVWRWNLGKDELQASLREDIFVPRVFTAVVADGPATVVVWPDAIPELMPEVDYLMVLRDELAPKGLLGGRKKDQILVPFDRLRPLLEPYRTDGFSLPVYRLPAPQVPDGVRAAVRALKATGIESEGLPMDQILTEEIVERVLRPNEP